jgi:hypothetical protein
MQNRFDKSRRKKEYQALQLRRCAGCAAMQRAPKGTNLLSPGYYERFTITQCSLAG